MKIFGKTILLYLSISGILPASSQVGPNMYWVQFTDKTNTPFSVDNPEEFLSERAINRRMAQNINITVDDLPVDPVYVDSLKSMGLIIHNTSKWLNGAVVISYDEDLIDTLHNISFISGPVRQQNNSVAARKIDKYCPDLKNDENYGLSKVQIEMLHGNHLHNAGFRGEGKLIAVLDAGFDNAKEIESLEHLWANDKIIASRDFVKDNQDIFSAHKHGTLVLSIIAGIIPGNIYGSAPDASFILVRTENGSSEYLVEEYNWVSGSEYADSLGVDVINSSLGYYKFDDPTQDHHYSDMNGTTTPVSRGAAMAARKGILVTNSAGNEGDDDWFRIIAPADADSILAIGAVDTFGIIAGFSSRGPSADGRVKPDVTAVGKGTFGQYQEGNIFSCNGTSCSAPIIAGLAACLWQSVPDANAMQIRNAIIKSSNRFEYPDSAYGYGIPDFILARIFLDSENNPQNDLTDIKLFPNPVTDLTYLSLELPWLTSAKNGVIELYDLNGSKISSMEKTFGPGENIIPLTYPPLLEKGYYFLQLTIDGRNYSVSFIKL